MAKLADSASSSGDWELFDLDALQARLSPGAVSIQEFLRTPSLSCALYQVPVGSKDFSSAHEEDELYLILRGSGQLRVGDSVHEVRPGIMMYVRASCDHAFFEVTEDITALAFFGAPLRQLRGYRGATDELAGDD